MVMMVSHSSSKSGHNPATTLILVSMFRVNAVTVLQSRLG
jgi:cytochrome b